MRNINRIIIHYAYTPPQMDIGVDEIREWHKQRNFRDIGYHYVIRRDGTVENGRPVEQAGAHTLGHNADSIGICIVGGKERNSNKSEVNFTCAQWRSLSVLVKELLIKYETITDISGHKDNAASECPGFNVREWAKTIW